VRIIVERVNAGRHQHGRAKKRQAIVVAPTAASDVKNTHCEEVW
jgi:hypothetical protein